MSDSRQIRRYTPRRVGSLELDDRAYSHYVTEGRRS